MHQITVGFTGHRKIDGKWGNQPIKVKKQLRETLLAIGPENISRAYIGMAPGFDWLAADVCMELGIVVVGCIPCLKHDAKWPPLTKRWYRDICQNIKKCGGKLTLTSNTEYTHTCMQERNEYICDHSQMLIAYWDGMPKGGTFNCISYWRRSKDIGSLFGSKAPDVINIKAFTSRQHMSSTVITAMDSLLLPIV